MSDTVDKARAWDAIIDRRKQGRIEGLKEAAEIVRKYKPLEWLANEILEGIEE